MVAFTSAVSMRLTLTCFLSKDYAANPRRRGLYLEYSMVAVGEQLGGTVTCHPHQLTKCTVDMGAGAVC